MALTIGIRIGIRILPVWEVSVTYQIERYDLA